MNTKGKGQLTLSERIAIEVGIYRKDSFKRIAREINRHPSTIAQEVLKNRTRIQGVYPFANDCKFAKQCKNAHVCGNRYCYMRCAICKHENCHDHCSKYFSKRCSEWESAPYVCNTCMKKGVCKKERYLYSAKYAQAGVKRRRSESRSGIRISDQAMKEMDLLVTKLVKQGQPLCHIYAEHKKELPVSLRTLYNYIDGGEMTIRNIDLRRKTGYRPRTKAAARSLGFQNQEYRQGRTYDDFEAYMKGRPDGCVTEMDTVKGVRESGKRLLTMILRRNSIMLLFLMPDGKAESVKRVFDYLEEGLSQKVFHRLFPLFLTDNGGEFKRVDELELTDSLDDRTRLFYCDPMASWQKPHIEKNHEFIRYVIPRGRSLNPYTQEDMTLLMNHINSVRRSKLNNKSPYELVGEEEEEMKALMNLLKMHLIPPDEVHLMPDLLKKK